MAQQKRLTRAQKILLSAIQGGKTPKEHDPRDAEELKSRGLIQKNHNRGWEAVNVKQSS